MNASRIQQLPIKLANQIAAGEVIERGASVVKELLENSLDSGATRVEIEIERGGKQRIRVTDNGQGIHPDDLGLALSKHATSKIHQVDDLFNLQSLGFRGEALASISAVSRFRICSRQVEQNDAFQAWLEGASQQAKISPCAHPQGTTVVVEDLFFNVPARRKFLRTDKTEFFHIQEVVTRLALSAYEVEFNFINQERIVWHLPVAATPTQREKRVLKLCGKPFIDNAYVIDFESNGLRLFGWLGLPDGARSQTDLQYFFVNDRIVKDRMLNHAIRQAYAEQLFPGKYPCYVLYLTLSADQVDVNVHPTKHEVRFHESRLIHDFIVSTLTKALRMQPVEQTIHEAILETPENAAVHTASPTPQTQLIARPSATYRCVKSTKSLAHQIDLAAVTLEETDLTGQDVTANQAVIDSEENPETERMALLTTQFVGVAADRYMIFVVDQQLKVYDTLVLQRFLYQAEWLNAVMSGARLPAKALLTPCALVLSEAERQAYLAKQSQLNLLGFEVDELGPNQYCIRQIPLGLVSQAASDCFKQLLQVDLNGSLANQLNVLAQFIGQIALAPKRCIMLLFEAESNLSTKQLQQSCQTLRLKMDASGLIEVNALVTDIES